MGNRPVIRVIVVDDSEAVRVSLRVLLNAFAEFKWVGESTDGRDILEQCAHLHPHILLLDVNLPHLAVETISAVHHAYPEIQIIGLAGFENVPNINRLSDAGMLMCISKTIGVDDLIQVMRQAAGLSLGSTRAESY